MNLKRILAITSLIVAGEIIFALPFHLARFFRPTLLEVFQITATELGSIQGIYGIVAMLCYFPGGLLADRFPTHKLLATSLWMTALGGFFMTNIPNYSQSLLLFAFFGMTTIMLFWGALIRATREWGGLNFQGTAFGMLEAGRGLLAVCLASVGVIIFEWSFPLGYDQATLLEKQSTFTIVIYGYTLITAITGIVIWFSLQQDKYTKHSQRYQTQFSQIIKNLPAVVRIPAVWWQTIIVLCAYVGYKSVDNLSLYAVEAYQFDAIEAAKLVTMAAWIRPPVALLTGIIADRTHPTKILILSFSLLIVTNLYLALSSAQINLIWIFIVNVLITCTAVFALRAIYFSVFEQYQLNIKLTGSAVGLISLIGFMPDIFVLYVAGRLIDSYPGIQGHQLFFMFLTAFSVVGFVSSILLKRAIKYNQQDRLL